MLEEWKKAFLRDCAIAVTITDCRESDCISHDLLVGKLDAYDLSLP